MKLHGQVGSKTDFEKHNNCLDGKFSVQAQVKLYSSLGPDDVLSKDLLTKKDLARGYPLILNSSISFNNLYCSINALKRVSANVGLGSKRYRYLPVLYSRQPNILANDKLLLAYKSHILSRIEPNTPLYGHVIYGPELRESRVNLEEHIKKARKIISELTLLASTRSDDTFFLNQHCEVCEFSEQCISKAVDRDCLSLFRGMRTVEIKRHNERGIFTVNQLSYTFRPRKTPKRAKNPAAPHHFSLQALAIRENNIYIHGKPPLICSESPVFFDIEGIPHRGLHYLVGLLTMEGDEPTYRYYWADDEHGQAKLVEDFLVAISDFDRSTFYHFGNYDKKALQLLRSLVEEPLQDILDDMMRRSQNLLSVVYPHVYFPTYTNRLKDIGRLLGCNWTDDNPSGMQSIMWREIWEETSDEALKERLLRYNKEDCLALKSLYDFLVNQTAAAAPNNSSAYEFSISGTDQLKQSSFNNSDRPLFGKAQFLLNELQFVNKCAYFDYQREKVYVKTQKELKKPRRNITNRKISSQRPNSFISVEARECVRCNKKRWLHKKDKLAKDFVDIRFSKAGVKKWIIRYVSWVYHCLNCGRKFIPQHWLPTRTQFGHGLLSWCVYHNVFRKQNMLQISHGLKDIFNLSIDYTSIHRFKSTLAAYYRDAYNEILCNILNSPSIHIDETNIRLGKSSGYVWVITTMNMVYYFYKESREGSFLKEMLAKYKGVLISDFFTAYDSIDCPQQKCLIHLIRDINETLKKNPFDTEFKKVSATFSEFLRAIVETIDHYGLKRRYLQKHKKSARHFLNLSPVQVSLPKSLKNFRGE